MAFPQRLPPRAADGSARCLRRPGSAFPTLRRPGGRSRRKPLRRPHRVLRAVPLRDEVVPSALREAAQSAVAARCLRVRESGFRLHRRNGGRLVVRLPRLPSRDDAFGLELPACRFSHRFSECISAFRPCLANAGTGLARRLHGHWCFRRTGPSARSRPHRSSSLIGLRVKLTLPQSWVVRHSGPNGPSIAMDLVNGRRLEIADTPNRPISTSTPQ
jgi:hypothetical protein